METQIKAAEANYGEFHNKASELYYIPSLQRPYTWDKKDVEKLWDDILENTSGYYIGSIVAIAAEGTTERDQIIDGQQRLTTISLILIAIRDYIFEKKVKGFSEIERDIDDFLMKYWKNGNQPRLSFFDDKSNEIYQKLVRGDAIDESQSNTQKKFLKNLAIIKSKLHEYSPKCKLSEIRELILKIGKLQLIFIKCTDRSAAYNLFESINATGIDLATTDLIKNSLFEALHDNKADLALVESGWKKMRELFGEDNASLKTYIRHHWISTIGYTSHTGLFDAFIKKYRGKELGYAKSLFSLSGAYSAMRNASVESLEGLSRRRYELAEIKEVMSFLSFLGVDQVYSVLLFIYQNDKDNFRKDLTRLTAFQFLYKYIPGSPSVPEKKYFANFCEGKISRSELFGGLFDLCQGQGDQFVKKLIEKTKFVEGKSGDIQFILERFIYSKNKASPGKFIRPTIEHIIPQDISDPIFAKFHCDKKDSLQKIHKLGNLTILEQEENTNRAQFNQVFSKKKSLYKKHAFVGNHDIMDYGFDTDPDSAIEKRGERISGEIYGIFLAALKNGKW